MGKRVLIISTSLRRNSNSGMLAKEFARGAKEAGNEVRLISLRGKKIGYCEGCYACQRLGQCIISDDAIKIEEEMFGSDVLVYATPVYYRGISGQMKTLLDRVNPRHCGDRKFREVYLLSCAAKNETNTSKNIMEALQGWIESFEGVNFAGMVFCDGVNEPLEIEGNSKLKEAYEMGKSV